MTRSAYEGGLGGYVGGSLMGFWIITAGSGERTNVLNPLWDAFMCFLSLEMSSLNFQRVVGRISQLCLLGDVSVLPPVAGKQEYGLALGRPC